MATAPTATPLAAGCSSKITNKQRGGLQSRSEARAAPASRGRSMRMVAMAKTASGDAAAAAAAVQVPRDDLPEVLIAGGGIAGLVTALALQRRGMKVKVFEKVKEYKLFGGPIQLQCNAQGALDSIAPDIGACQSPPGRRGRGFQSRTLSRRPDFPSSSSLACKPKPRSFEKKEEKRKAIEAGVALSKTLTSYSLSLTPQPPPYPWRTTPKTPRAPNRASPAIKRRNDMNKTKNKNKPNQTAEMILDKSTITGDRVNGLLDGVLGDWFYRFDTRKPCHENGLPLTLVIARYDLLDILRNAVGPESIVMETVVEKYEHKGDRVIATLANGDSYEGDVLIGADGIRSKMRAQIRGEDPEKPPLAYAGYAVYTAICDYSAPHREPIHTDVDKTGYQVFLGPKQYFVSSDVGKGQQQYYAFLDVPPGGDDKYAKCEEWANYREMLMDRFSGWCPAVMERLVGGWEEGGGGFTDTTVRDCPNRFFFLFFFLCVWCFLEAPSSPHTSRKNDDSGTSLDATFESSEGTRASVCFLLTRRV